MYFYGRLFKSRLGTGASLPARKKMTEMFLLPLTFSICTNIDFGRNAL